jgi:hypothetical protein
MLHHDIVKELLLTSISELENDPSKFAVNPGKDFSRNRKLGFQDLILTLLTMEGDCLKEEIYRYFGYDTSAPSKTAFYKQRKKLLTNALRELLVSFNDKLDTKLFRDKYQLIACDGSALEIFRNPDDSDSFHPPNGQSKTGFNQIHINSFYSILDKRFTDIVVQPCRKTNEYAAFCSMVDAAKSILSIFLGDRGYASYNAFAHVIENNQFFAIRCTDFRLERMLGYSLEGVKDLDCHIDRILTRPQSKKKRLHPELADQYRTITKEVPFDYLNENCREYHISLRIVRFKLSDNSYENIITNLPDIEFKLSDFKALYYLRWNEETAYRYMKYPLCLKELHSKKYEYAIQEVWARAILNNFSTAIVNHVEINTCETKHTYQANLSQAFKICRSFLRLRDNDAVFDAPGLIAQNIEPVRPGRTYTRQPRFKKPFSLCYRN